jgi:hypothetical protein
MVSEHTRLLAMLKHAKPAHGYQHLEVRDEATRITMHTGPDDAVVLFTFDEQDRLATVSVTEAG